MILFKFIFLSVFLLTTLISKLVQAKGQCSDLFYNFNTHSSHIFESSIPVIHLKMKSNFTQISRNSENDNPENLRLKKTFPATLIWNNGEVEIIKAKAFGDSSANKDESTFRKLHLIFSDGTQIYINTHVQTHPKEQWTPQGRITDGTSPFREALAYDIAKVLNVDTPAYQRFLIEYTDIDTGQKFTKPALIIENFKDTARRKKTKLAPEKALDEIKSRIPKGAANVAVVESLRLHLFQILIGNSDYQLEIYNTQIPRSYQYSDIKNVVLTQEHKNAVLKPLAYDFDVASIVAGYEVSEPSKPWALRSELTSDPVTSTMLRGLLALKMMSNSDDLRLALTLFKSSKEKLTTTINNAVVDEVGRLLALDHVNHFFEASELVFSSKIKFNKASNQRLYPKAKEYGSLLEPVLIPPWFERTKPRTLRLGAPVLILGEENEFYKVLFIDTHYELQDYTKHIGYIKKEAL